MPITLGVSPLAMSGTNGFNMMLAGSVNSNYLIEASTDLVNWTPIVYLTSTNSSFYFTDPSATNFNRRFYRAVMP